MDDLEHLPELVEPTGNPARFAQWKLLSGPSRIAPEIRERANVARRVLCVHPERRAGRAAGAVITRGQLDDHLFANAGFIEVGHGAALHEPVGQVIDQIAHPRQPKLFQRALQAKADPLEGFGFGKQGIEPVGTHDVRFIAGTGDLARFDAGSGILRAYLPQRMELERNRYSNRIV